MEIKNNKIVATPRSKYHKYLFGGSSGSSSGGSISIDTNNFVKKTGETSQTVEGDIIVNGNIISTGEVSAYGAGSSSGGGSGLISSVLGSAGLGGSYLDSDYTNTFNAYTINLINTSLTSALGRIGALETSTPNVSWGTATGQYSPLTINSVTRNLSVDGHTHSYLPLSGGNLTGALTISGNTVWHAGNDGAGSGLDADLLDGLNPSQLNVLSATKLANTRTIWGRSFNGEGNVSGAITGATTGTFSSTISATTGIFSNLTANYIPKHTAGGLANSLIYDNGTNVGIGRADPGYKLDVSGDIRSNYMYFKKYNDNGVAGYIGRGSSNNNNLQLLSYSENSVYIGANENGVDGITINTSNNVGIGTISPSYKLDVNGVARIGNSTSNGLIINNGSKSVTLTVDSSGNLKVDGNFYATGEVTAYSASDIRLKTNIKPITSAIDVINKLNPVSYNWNEKAKELNPLKTDSTEYGLIAQELEKVMPELVHPIYDGEYKSIDYVKIVPLLIGAIKELQLEINELKNK